ncbi:trk active potasium channel [Plesiocystis pacifica SIR-1]|uniref:Trk active potasium channel n=1 Tax=Plesiocystis pacifica SIR-1 TaxID=391625 RepID=A6FZZ0_9BACT|nr:NAD-binding protein [Plesiocystis pacifica]EDM80946.1 trk active potasium channel [Plesiocystis pacifica SIR-1]
MRRPFNRLFSLLGFLVLTLLVAATVYMLGMEHLEGQERDFWSSLEWAAETLTTTGYGNDSHWEHPLMIVFVASVQFFGLMVTLSVVPIVLIPWFESRFEARLPQALPEVDDFVLVYRWGPAVSSLVRNMSEQRIATVILEENESRARWLRDRGHKVVYASLEEGQLDLRGIERCRAIIANGEDHDNAAVIAMARQLSFDGSIYALVDTPKHRRPILLSGADAVYSPMHSLAAGLAAKASDRIAPRVSGVQMIGADVEVGELRIHEDSPMRGKSLTELSVRAGTGATVVGLWTRGQFRAPPDPQAALEAGTIVVALGDARALAKLGELATPLDRSGPLLVIGYGEVGQKLVEMLESVGESVRVLARDHHPRLDVCGDALDPQVLEAAGIVKARVVILAFSADSTALFAATIIRDIAPNLPIIAAVDRAENIERVHRAGADHALSISQVTAQLLGYKLFGEHFAAAEPRMRVFDALAAPFAGLSLSNARLPERTGCTVVAVERRDHGETGETLTQVTSSDVLEEEDILYLCGASDARERFFREFPAAMIE